MPGSFDGIHLTSYALRAFQYGLEVTGHNLANVNTRGYSRQTIEYGANDPMSFWAGRTHSIGQGVGIESINRIRDLFLDGRMQLAQGDLGRFQTTSSALGAIQTIYNEPGANGISAALDKFFNAWSALGSNPNQPANRIEVQQAGQTLANRIRGTFGELRTREAQVDTEIQLTIEQVNVWSQRIYDLNQEIRASVSAGGAPNDLLDQRDVAIEELSKLVNIVTTQDQNGAINVHFGGFPLVDVAGAHDFPPSFNSQTYSVSSGGQTFQVTAGKLYGLFEVANKVDSYKSSLDTLANTLRAEFNALHQTGTNPNGTTNIAFFNQNPTPPQNGAIDFDLGADIKADINNIASSVSGADGDGALAISMANLRNADSALLGGKTYSKWYSEMIAGVGRDAQYHKEQLNTQSAMAQQVENQRQAVSGVSIDDEMANMMRFQRSYQAAARALSVFDQVTEELIGIIR